MTGPPLTRALVDALAGDPDALDRLAELLAPRLAAPATAPPMTVEQAASTAGVSARTIRRALTASLLDGRRVAGRWQTTPAALTAWQAQGGPTDVQPLGRPARAHHGPRRATRAATGADAILGAGRVDG